MIILDAFFCCLSLKFICTGWICRQAVV